VRGQVLPATLSDVRLWAELTDGRRIQGESNITKAGAVLSKLAALPPIHPPYKALQAIQEADYIIIGPGSLYTSVIPICWCQRCGSDRLRCGVGKPRLYLASMSVIS